MGNVADLGIVSMLYHFVGEATDKVVVSDVLKHSLTTFDMVSMEVLNVVLSHETSLAFGENQRVASN